MTAAAEDDPVIVPLFCPTSPPAPMPVKVPPLTVLPVLPIKTETLLTMPSFSPASGPMNIVLAPAVMETSANLRFRTVPFVPMNGNSPSGEDAPDKVRLLIVELTPSPPLPSNRPAKVMPTGNPVKPVALKSLPRA